MSQYGCECKGDVRQRKVWYYVHRPMKPTTRTENIAVWLALAIIGVAVGFLVFSFEHRPAYSGGLAILFLVLLATVVARQHARRIFAGIERELEKEPKDDPSEPARFV